MKESGIKTCQCGAQPAWVQVRTRRKRGRHPSASPELLECQACGNSAGPSSSREKLADEWNTAGWCGQGSPATEYVPFGPEWRAQCMRMRKPELIGLLADTSKQRLALYGLVAKLHGELGEAATLIARLGVRQDRRAYNAIIDRLVQLGIIEKADAAGANLSKKTR